MSRGYGKRDLYGHTIKFWDFSLSITAISTLRCDGCMDNLFSHNFYWNNIIECEYLWSIQLIFLKTILYISPFFPCLLHIYETLNEFFSKQCLDAISGLTNYASTIFKNNRWFSSTSIIGNNRRPDWHNFGGITIRMNFQLWQRYVDWFC